MYSNLKAEMARRDLKAIDLCKRTGMSPSSLSQKISGKRGFTLVEAVKISKALGIADIATLFEKG